VGSIGVVVADPTPDPGSSLTAGLEGIEEDVFVFERSPQPLDEDVVHPAAATVHRDADVGLLQGVGEGKPGELRALIGVEDLGLAEAGNRVTQKSASIVFDSLQLRTFRLNQSMIAIRYRKPLRIGMLGLRTRPGSADRWSDGEADMAIPDAGGVVRWSLAAGRSAPNPSSASADGHDGAQRTSHCGANAASSAGNRTTASRGTARR
jgi:hypothetical protein